jgi:hypothetical protein
MKKTTYLTILLASSVGALAQTALSDFSLPNVNSTSGSDRIGQTIEPKQYRQQVLAVYFGHEW